MLLLVAMALAPTLALAETITWPDLPKTCFVSGRSATSVDIDSGCAAFTLNVQGKPAGSPIKVDAVSYTHLTLPTSDLV